MAFLQPLEPTTWLISKVLRITITGKINFFYDVVAGQENELFKQVIKKSCYINLGGGEAEGSGGEMLNKK